MEGIGVASAYTLRVRAVARAVAIVVNAIPADLAEEAAIGNGGVDAARDAIAGIDCADLAVVAGRWRAREARAPRALVIGRARIVVAARCRVIHELATHGGIASVVGALLVVIAGQDRVCATRGIPQVHRTRVVVVADLHGALAHSGHAHISDRTRIAVVTAPPREGGASDAGAVDTLVAAHTHIPIVAERVVGRVHAAGRRVARVERAGVAVGAVLRGAPDALACRTRVSDRALVPVLALRRVGSDCALLGVRVVAVVRADITVVADHALLGLGVAHGADTARPETGVERLPPSLQGAAHRLVRPLVPFRAWGAVPAAVAIRRHVGRGRRAGKVVLTPRRERGEAGHHEQGGRLVVTAQTFHSSILRFTPHVLRGITRNLFEPKPAREHPGRPLAATESARLSVELLHSTHSSSAASRAVTGPGRCFLHARGEPFPRTYNKKFV